MTLRGVFLIDGDVKTKVRMHDLKAGQIFELYETDERGFAGEYLGKWEAAEDATEHGVVSNPITN